MFDSIEPKAVPAPPSNGKLQGREGLLARHRWLAFLVPLAVYMLAGSLEPKPPQPEAQAGWLAIPYHYYPVVYTFKLSLTLGAILWVLPGYRGFSFRVRPLPVLVGAVGVVVWVGLCELKLEQRWLVPLGLGRLVDLDRPDFEGRADLLVAKAAGPERLLVGLSTRSHLIPRTGADLLHDGAAVGRVTSGSMSPVLGHPIALGYVRPVHAEVGTELTALVRGREVPMTVVPRPFYRKGETPLPGLGAHLAPTDEPG